MGKMHKPTYKDETFKELANDGTYATVRVTAWFRPSAQSDWIEQYADVEVRNVGGQWQTSPFMPFRPTQAETQRQLDRQQTRYAAAATIYAETQVSADATKTAIAQQTSSVVSVKRTATSETAKRIMTSEATDETQAPFRKVISDFGTATINHDCQTGWILLTAQYATALKEIVTEDCPFEIFVRSRRQVNLFLIRNARIDSEYFYADTSFFLQPDRKYDTGLSDEMVCTIIWVELKTRKIVNLSACR